MTMHSGDLAVRQIRGSSLLFVGRLIARGIEFAVQVLLIRYLAQADYGALAYGLSIVLLGQTLVSLGLPETVARFVPLYREQRRYDRLLGTIVLAVGVIAALGVAGALAFRGFTGAVGQVLVQDVATAKLLLILVFLIPVEALNNLLTNLFASFARPRAIFFRRAVLAPGLKLAAALATIALERDVTFLAGSLLIAGLVGLAVYGFLFVQLLAKEDLLRRLRESPIRPPLQEVSTFALSMVSSTTIWLLLQSSSTLLLGYYHGAAEVAAFAVVLPLVGLSQMVTGSFTILYTPLATRLHAREDLAGVGRLYWQTATWMAMICFPIFAMTLAFPGPLLTALYGSRYDSSATVLAVLAVGSFFQAATGFNGLTLRVFRRLRYSVAIDLLAVLCNVGLSLVLVPRWGALGAAMATTATLVVHNLLKQAGLQAVTGIGLCRGEHLRVYLAMALAPLGLMLLAPLVPGTLAAVAVTLLASGLVAAAGRHALDVTQTFPELARLPIVRVVFPGSQVEVGR
ncbi:MAG: oligosaccharide flippase family protein [Chloroflexi bacterium]|nr:oligosaccharide flippase family protein [Chloroflexota bacterium]